MRATALPPCLRPTGVLCGTCAAWCRRWNRVVLALAALAFGILQPAAAFESTIRGTHYFGDAWGPNFWNSARLSAVDNDLKAISRDGFNTIVLVIPWGEFQPRMAEPSRFDDVIFGRLRVVLDSAARSGLDVVLRVGYPHSFSPFQDVAGLDRKIDFLASAAARRAFFLFVQRLQQEVSRRKHVRFGFMSWEDLNFPHLLASPAAREQLSKGELGKDWITFLAESSSLPQVKEHWGRTFGSLEEVPLPNPATAQAALLHRFWDWFLVHRFFEPAQQVFPTMSFEARVDDDPVTNLKGERVWTRHDATYRMPGAKVDTIYWGIFWGMENRSDQVSADKALATFKYLLDRVDTMTGRRRTFIDQFVFRDNTPGSGHLTRIADAEVDRSSRPGRKGMRCGRIWPTVGTCSITPPSNAGCCNGSCKATHACQRRRMVVRSKCKRGLRLPSFCQAPER